jgi:hypothetical protein
MAFPRSLHARLQQDSLAVVHSKGGGSQVERYQWDCLREVKTDKAHLKCLFLLKINLNVCDTIVFLASTILSLWQHGPPNSTRRARFACWPTVTLSSQRLSIWVLIYRHWVRHLFDCSDEWVADKLFFLGGLRSKRYSMLIDNGVVKELNVEPDGTGLSCSLADKLKLK